PYLMTGDGSGHLRNILNPGLPASFRPLRASDLDGDGHIDIVGTTNTFINYLRGDGIGGFTVVDTKIQDPRIAVAIDQNGDGKIDLALFTGAFATSQWVAVVPNDGKGNFNVGFRADVGSETIAVA